MSIPQGIKRVICLLLAACFFFQNTLTCYGQAFIPTLTPQAFNFNPPTLKYLSVNSANPYNYFNFLLDKGSKASLANSGAGLEQEAKKLIHYFFIGLTLPESSLWVNLRPDEPGRITSLELAQTDMGKLLLEQDLRLKKDVAQYLNPSQPIGKRFWEELYSQAELLLGKGKLKKTAITTSNRVWIVPDEAVVMETEDGALVTQAKLKVLLESEYLSLKSKSWNKEVEVQIQNKDQLKNLTEALMKTIVIPEITREVNSGKNYAPLRQIYHSLILAQWFKQKYRKQKKDGKDIPYIEAIDQSWLKGLESEFPWSKDAIWQEYLASFQKGEYQLKEKLAGLNRMYTSGGVTFIGMRVAVAAPGASSPMTNPEVRENTALVVTGRRQNHTGNALLPGNIRVIETASAASPLEEQDETTYSSLSASSTEEKIRRLLERLQNSPGMPVYFDVIKALGEMGPPAIPALVKLLKDENVAHYLIMVQGNVIKALGEMGPPAIPALVKLLKDENLVRPFAYEDVVKALGEMGPPAIPALVKLLKDENLAYYLNRGNVVMALYNIMGFKAILNGLTLASQSLLLEFFLKRLISSNEELSEDVVKGIARALKWLDKVHAKHPSLGAEIHYPVKEKERKEEMSKLFKLLSSVPVEHGIEDPKYDSDEEILDLRPLPGSWIAFERLFYLLDELGVFAPQTDEPVSYHTSIRGDFSKEAPFFIISSVFLDWPTFYHFASNMFLSPGRDFVAFGQGYTYGGATRNPFTGEEDPVGQTNINDKYPKITVQFKDKEGKVIGEYTVSPYEKDLRRKALLSVLFSSQDVRLVGLREKFMDSLSTWLKEVGIEDADMEGLRNGEFAITKGGGGPATTNPKLAGLLEKIRIRILVKALEEELNNLKTVDKASLSSEYKEKLTMTIKAYEGFIHNPAKNYEDMVKALDSIRIAKVIKEVTGYETLSLRDLHEARSGQEELVLARLKQTPLSASLRELEEGILNPVLAQIEEIIYPSALERKIVGIFRDTSVPLDKLSSEIDKVLIGALFEADANLSKESENLIQEIGGEKSRNALEATARVNGGSGVISPSKQPSAASPLNELHYSKDQLIYYKLMPRRDELLERFYNGEDVLEQLKALAKNFEDIEGGLMEALQIYTFLWMKDEIANIIEKIKIHEKSGLAGNDIMLPRGLIERMKAHERAYREKYGLEGNPGYSWFNSLLAAYFLKEKYDIAIGIAGAGTFTSSVFDLLGVKTALASVHSQGREFKWLDEVEEAMFKGKRIIIVENDLVTGGTLRRLIDEIRKYEPGQLDVIFEFPGFVREENIPKEQLGQVFYAKKHYDLSLLIGAVEAAREKLNMSDSEIRMVPASASPAEAKGPGIFEKKELREIADSSTGPLKELLGALLNSIDTAHSIMERDHRKRYNKKSEYISISEYAEGQCEAISFRMVEPDMLGDFNPGIIKGSAFKGYYKTGTGVEGKDWADEHHILLFELKDYFVTIDFSVGQLYDYKDKEFLLIISKPDPIHLTEKLNKSYGAEGTRWRKIRSAPSVTLAADRSSSSKESSAASPLEEQGKSAFSASDVRKIAEIMSGQIGKLVNAKKWPENAASELVKEMNLGGDYTPGHIIKIINEAFLVFQGKPPDTLEQYIFEFIDNPLVGERRAVEILNDLSKLIREKKESEFSSSSPLSNISKEPWDIDSVKTLDDLARFIVIREKSNSLTSYIMQRAYVKYAELSERGSQRLGPEEKIGVFKRFLKIIKQIENKELIDVSAEDRPSRWLRSESQLLGIDDIPNSDSEELQRGLAVNEEMLESERLNSKRERIMLTVLQYKLKEAIGRFVSGEENLQEIIAAIKRINKIKLDVSNVPPKVVSVTDEEMQRLIKHVENSNELILRSVPYFFNRRDSLINEIGFLVNDENRGIFIADLKEIMAWKNTGLPQVEVHSHSDLTAFSLEDLILFLDKDKDYIDRINILRPPLSSTIRIEYVKREDKTNSSSSESSSPVRASADSAEPVGGIDLSQIEVTLKDEKFVSRLKPADLKVLRAAKYLKEGWSSLSLLYVHEIMLLLKDNLANDIKQKGLLQEVLKQLQVKGLIVPEIKLALVS